MSYEFWCLKNHSTTYRYILMDVDSETSSSISRTVQDAFASFGTDSTSMQQRAEARPFCNITPVAYLENYCNDRPELLL